MNKTTGVVLGVVILIGVGATATTLLAFKDMPLNLAQVLNPTPQRAVDSGSGTTTPIKDGIFTPPPIPEAPPKDIYGSLENTYTDKKTGLSFKYPSELRVVDAGDGLALQHSTDKTFSLKICGADSMCADGYVKSSTKSLADLEKESTKAPNGSLSERITPLTNTTVRTDAGVSVLKQKYVKKILDDKGNDITAQECEMCGGEKTQYVLFKSPQNFFILRPGQFNDPVLEAKIIQSITY